jgi:hypothetical protein
MPTREEVERASARVIEKPVERIARVCHEVNRVLQRVAGEESSPAWDNAPAWQRESAVAGVRAALNGTANSPEAQHEAWSAHKLADGWRFGPVKDAEAKTHPCLVPYNDLPPVQRAKDEAFRAVVEAMTS